MTNNPAPPVPKFVVKYVFIATGRVYTASNARVRTLRDAQAAADSCGEGWEPGAVRGWVEDGEGNVLHGEAA